MEKQTPVDEARRYLDNARQILSEKANKEDGRYQDRKYVKLAGHAAYSAILIALDGLFGKKNKGRKNVDWYLNQLASLDRKALGRFNDAYDTLHLALAYDGNRSAKVAASGLEDAEWLINWVETRNATA